MKKLIGLLLALSLALSLCACGVNPLKPLDIPTAPTATEAPSAGNVTEAATDATVPPTSAATKVPTKAPTQAPTTAPTTVATVAPTTAATTAATEAPTTAPTNPNAPVKTVLDCTYPHENAGDSFIQEHSFKCPALTADTPGALAINTAIYTQYANTISDIENGKADSYICQYDYSYAEYNGLIAIALRLTVAYIQSEFYTIYQTYYYDANTGKQLTYEEYLSALEISEQQLLTAFNAVSDIANSPVIYGYKIVGATVGKEETKLIVFYQHDMGDLYTTETVKTSDLK